MAQPTKNELRNQHKQQRIKHEKRQKRLEAEEQQERKRRRKELDHSMSNSQVGRLVGYFRELDFERTTLKKVRDVLLEKALAVKSPFALDGKTGYDTEEEALTALHGLADSLSELVGKVALKNHVTDDENLLWAKKMVESSPNLNDKASSAAILIQACPPLAAQQLATLRKNIKAVNRTEFELGVQTFLEIWQSKLVPAKEEYSVLFKPESRAELKEEFKLSEAALKAFVKEKDNKYYLINLGELGADTPHSRLLMCLHFEHQLVHLTNELYLQFKQRTTDPVEHTRKLVYTSCFSMIKKATMRETGMRLCLKHFGDRNSTFSGRMTLALGQVMLKAPELTPLLAQRAEELIWMQQVDAISLAERNAERASENGLIKKKTSALLNKRAHNAKMRIKKALKNSAGGEGADGVAADVTTSVVDKSLHQVHNTVANATKFLSELLYHEGDSDFMKTQIKRYLRILSKMTEESPAPKLIKIQSKQIAFVKKNKKLNETDKTELAQAVSRISGSKTPYIVGLASCVAGAAVMRHVLMGIRRVLPYASDELINQLAHTKSAKRGKRGMKPQESPAAAKDKILTFPALNGELLKVAHRSPCIATRVNAWTLCYAVLKRLKQEANIYNNLYSQLKDVRYMRSNGRNAWLKLHTDIITDHTRCPAEVRAAYLRRLLGVMLLSTKEGAMLPIFMVLGELIKKDETALKEWVSECLGVIGESGTVDATKEYDADHSNCAKSGAMSSCFWELSLAKCSIVPAVSDAYAALSYELDAEESGTEVPSVLDLVGWRSLVPIDTSKNVDNMYCRLYEVVQNSQSLGPLYKLLRNQTLRSAVRDRVIGEKPTVQEGNQSIWDYDIRNIEFWKRVDESEFNFPFRKYIEPFSRKQAKARTEFEDFDAMVDGTADHFVVSGH